MTDSANFQSQMSEIWKARREREMYRLDLEKEVYIKKQQREKRRDELRSKVKALHDDLVREDITSSQRVKILLSKVESLKSEHQVLAAHTERLKLKKRQIELQLVTSYPIIHHAVQQEIRNPHLSMGLSQVGHTPFLQNSRSSGPQQPLQNSGQPEHPQQSRQPYNVMQLGGVGETGYRGIPGIISTVNQEMDNYMLVPPRRERLENHAEANQSASNKHFGTSSKIEDQRNESIQNYLSTLENRIYSNPASPTSEHVMPRAMNNEVSQRYNSPVASSYHFPTHEQISNHRHNHRHPAAQEGINSDIVQNPAYYSIQKGNSQYSPKQFPSQRLNSPHENNANIQQQLKSNVEIEYAESVSTAHNTNVTKTQVNNSTSQSYDLENVPRSLEQARTLEQYSIIKEDEETIRSRQYTQNPPMNIQHTSKNENQSHEIDYDQKNYQHNEDSYSNSIQYNDDEAKNDHSNDELQNYRENKTNSENYTGHITDSQDYREHVAGSQNYRDSRSNSENYINNTTDSQYYKENLTDSQNYRERITDSQYYRKDAINSQNDRESITDSQNYREKVTYSQNYREDETNSQNNREDITDSPNYRENVSDSQNYKEDVTGLQNDGENVKESSFKSNTQEDYSQAENVDEYSQESHDSRNQPKENQLNMEYQNNANENQDYDEYRNQDSASYMNKYENHSQENEENKLVEEKSIRSSSNNHQLSTIKTSVEDESLNLKTNQETRDELLNSKTNQKKLTHQDTEDSKNTTSSFNKDNNIYNEEDSDFFERAGPVTSSAAYQNLLGVAAPSLGIESDSDDMEGQMAAMALKQKLPNTGPPSLKAFASKIPSLRPSAAILTDSDSVDSVEAAIQAAMNKKADQGTGNNDVQRSETKAKLSESSTSNPVPVLTAQQNFPTQLGITKAKPKTGNTALQLNLSDDESYNVSGGANESYDEDDDDFFD